MYYKIAKTKNVAIMKCLSYIVKENKTKSSVVNAFFVTTTNQKSK